MRLEQLKENLPDYAKDIRLNLSNLFGNIDSSGLTPAQFYGTALSIAYSLKNKEIFFVLAYLKIWDKVFITKCSFSFYETQ